ncbi:MAG: TylF/MycF/NovP-related O-methyltransferase [Acidiferrobacterales bacterium]
MSPAVADDFGKDLAVVREYTMLSRRRLLSLYECVLECERSDVRGDYVECGVWKGGAVGLMALANLRHGKNRRDLHLFDTFEGIPEPDESVDGERAVKEAKRLGVGFQGRLTSNPQFYEKMDREVGTLESNKRLLEETVGYDSRFIHYHKGFFQQTVPKAVEEIDSIAILRLDGDWYASTKVCLDYLYDKVVSSGFVIIDDYGAYEGCRRAVDEFLAARQIKVKLREVGAELRLFAKP